MKKAVSKNVKNYTRSAYYYETDRMGIVHHSNYVRWFEEARLAYMHACGLDYKALEARGMLIPVLGYTCVNKHAVRFEETFEVRLWPTAFNGVRLRFAYEVRLVEGDILAATGTSEHCFTDAQLRPLNLKRKYPDVYEKICAEMETNPAQ